MLAPAARAKVRPSAERTRTVPARGPTVTDLPSTGASGASTGSSCCAGAPRPWPSSSLPCRPSAPWSDRGRGRGRGERGVRSGHRGPAGPERRRGSGRWSTASGRRSTRSPSRRCAAARPAQSAGGRAVVGGRAVLERRGAARGARHHPGLQRDVRVGHADRARGVHQPIAAAVRLPGPLSAAAATGTARSRTRLRTRSRIAPLIGRNRGNRPCRTDVQLQQRVAVLVAALARRRARREHERVRAPRLVAAGEVDA